MTLKWVIIKHWQKVKKLPRKYTVPSAALLGLIFMYSLIFLIHKPVTFSYAGETCARQMTLFPAIHKFTDKKQGFTVIFSKSLKVGSFTVASLQTCFIATKPPTEGSQTVATSPFGSWLMQKTFSIKIPAPPIADLHSLNRPIPTLKPLSIPLSDTDKVFTYTLKADGKDVACKPEDKTALCDIKELHLIQGAPYTIEIAREFNDEHVNTVAKKEIKTLPATTIVDSSIKQGETVFSKPRTIEITFDKKIAKITPVLYKIEGDKRVKQNTRTSFQDKKVQVSTDELPRLSDYVLETGGFEATDGSGLGEPFSLAFKISGSPKVAGLNIGTTRVPLGTTAVITFDQVLSEKQDTSKIITSSGGAVISSKKGNQVFVSLAGVPKCGGFSIKVTNDLQSSYGIGGNSAWNFTGRMICHTVSTIGYSSLGKAINAYYFGSGPRTMVYTGAIHGNELSSKYLMDQWIEELENNPPSIPADKNVVVIPQINPDGVASGIRVNARNVDLNRNFATSDWRSDITTVANQPFPGGGGPSPMSEPETQVLASFIQRTAPVLVLSYHSIGGIVIANQAGDSNNLVNTYSQLSGYRNTTGQTAETFEYSISGTADDWYAEKLGIPSILIELGSHTNSQFSRNQKAMWAMLRS